MPNRRASKAAAVVATVTVGLLMSGCAGTAAPGTPAPPTASGGHDPDGVVRTAGCATATSPPAMSIYGTPQPANQDRLDRLAARVDQIANTRFADVYAGVELVQARDRILVRRTPSDAFDAWIVRQFATDCVEIVDARYPLAQLRQWQSRIGSDIPYWRSNGVRINTVAADAARGVVEVGTLDVDRARQLLPAHYGPGIPIEVVKR
ncbi:MAG TPA: hypothetical protein VF049_00180, partial [Nocardioidaceae bacterium]